MGDLFALLIAGSIIFGVTITVFSAKTQCYDHSKIQKVGGCDEYGSCGVEYENGTYGKSSFPVVGKEECTKFKRIHWYSDNFWK